MRLTVLAAGSQGDVRPFTALGAGLARAGHDVRMATHDTFQGIVASAGLEFARIGVNPLEIVQGKTGQAWLASMDNPIRFMSNVARLARDVLDSLNDDAWAACQGSDAIIYSLPLSLSGHTMADSLGVPGIPAALYPLHPTRAFPSIMTPRLPLHGGAANWLSGRVVVQVFWQVFRSQQNRWRKSRLGLPPHPLRPPLASWRKNGVPVLYGYSPSVVPQAGDWDQTCAVCGYWFSPMESWSPPAALSDFLAAGPMPLYIGFGSMASADPSRMTAIVLEALRRTGHRAILASGWGGLLDEALPQSVLPVESVPHEWLFPRVAAAVHHGGAGTTAAALRAGIPSIVVPFFADQFFWGLRLSQLGAASPPLPQKKLSVQGLVQAIQSVTGTPSYAKGARMLSEKIAAERGVDAAVGVVDGYLRSTMRHRIQ
ncbi:MAG: glycosyltransferase [Spirochaetia bacterium]|jgi:UDP:flavonoid glycosyltransferase YjiC (YdhE family)